jgi:tight adherence protein B
MLEFTAAGFLFLTVVFGALALFGPLRLGWRRSEERLVGLRRQQVSPTTGEGDAAFKRAPSSIPTLGRLLRESEWARQAEEDLAQANVHLRVGEYLLIRLGLSIAAFFLIGLVTQFNVLGVLAGIFTGGILYLLVPSFLHMLRKRRLDAIEQQLVEFLPMLASSLRAGFAIQQGMELAQEQLGPPLADELAVLVNDTNLGSTLDQALLDMGARVGSPDLEMIITAILVQRSSGGNLSEILETTAHTLRERERIRGDIKTLTASQRLTGLILSVYPVAVGLLLLAIMPSMWSVLFTETLGQVFLGIALGLQVIGFLVMRRVMQVQI